MDDNNFVGITLDIPNDVYIQFKKNILEHIGDASIFVHKLSLDIKTTPTHFCITICAVPKECCDSTVTEYLEKIQHLEREEE
jgi:hypothetical protein